MIRIAIVEDEEQEAEQLVSLLRRFEREEKETLTISSFSDGMNFVSDYRPVYDIVLMDIEMPFLNGMQAARKMRRIDGRVALIFITHLAKYALQGYEVDAAGYLVKPIEYPSLAKQLKKVIARNEFGKDEEIFIKSTSGMVKIDLNRLLYVEVIGHYLIWHTATGEHKSYGQFFKAEEMLPAPRFFRCSKSYLVNFRFVTKVTKTSVWIGDEEILVSRSRQKELLPAFNRYLEGVTNG